MCAGVPANLPLCRRRARGYIFNIVLTLYRNRAEYTTFRVIFREIQEATWASNHHHRQQAAGQIKTVRGAG